METMANESPFLLKRSLVSSSLVKYSLPPNTSFAPCFRGVTFGKSICSTGCSMVVKLVMETDRIGVQVDKRVLFSRCLDVWFVLHSILWGGVFVFSWTTSVFPDAMWNLPLSLNKTGLTIPLCILMSGIPISFWWSVWLVFRCVSSVSHRIIWLGLFLIGTPLTIPLFYLWVIRPRMASG